MLGNLLQYPVPGWISGFWSLPHFIPAAVIEYMYSSTACTAAAVRTPADCDRLAQMNGSTRVARGPWSMFVLNLLLKVTRYFLTLIIVIVLDFVA
jgi:hypothetical protein